MTLEPLDTETLHKIFVQPRTAYRFTHQEVTEEQLRTIYDLTKMGPTAFNSQPLRLTFLRSTTARERLLPHVAPSNQPQIQQAPVSAILSFDTCWVDKFEQFNPSMAHAAQKFSREESRLHSAEQSATLSAGYLITAIRALGLSAGPMTGASFSAINQEFFPDGKQRAFMIVNIGYSTPTPYKRNPRFSFEEVAEIL
ncbi:malonic semialdehyde reductase [Rothia sp. P7208]|uniref:malonic semialdehyde reductase n=1 Tax=Rothia sp. P7208 TaxID=3402660 RepID=UPI003AC2692C